MESRGQVSAEFLLLILVVLIIFAGVTIPLLGSSINATTDISKSSDAKSSLIEIANAVNIVYANGPGAKRTVDVYIPQDNSYLTYNNYNLTLNVTLSNGTMNIKAATDCPVVIATGVNPLNKGFVKFRIQVLGNGTVRIDKI